MTAPDRDTIKFAGAIASIIQIPILIGIGGWVAVSVVDHESRIGKIEEWKAEGARYTMNDHAVYTAAHEIRHEALERFDQDIDDRVRDLEFLKP